MLRIGFYLRGAIPVITRGPRDRAGRENWFSKYLVKRGVLTGGSKDSKDLYKLATPVEGNYPVTTAPDEAYELGHMIGLLSRARKDPSREDAPLDDNAITLLASCGTPRHAAAAIQVELDIFREWFEDFGRPMFRKLQWSNPDAVRAAYKKLMVSNANVAMHSTRLKYVGYKTNEPEEIVQRCAKYLLDKHGELWKRKWLSYWKAAKVLEATGEKAIFDPMLDDASRVCWEAALLVFVIEICLAQYLVAHPTNPEDLNHLHSALRKYDEYSRAMKSVGLASPENTDRAHDIVAAWRHRASEMQLLFPRSIVLFGTSQTCSPRLHIRQKSCLP